MTTTEHYPPAAEVRIRRRSLNDPPQVTRRRNAVRVIVAGAQIDLRHDVAMRLAHDLADALTSTDTPEGIHP